MEFGGKNKYYKKVENSPLFHCFCASEFLMELREYGPVYSSWSSFEEDLHDPLEGVSGCVSNCSSALEELTEDMSEDFLPVLREYVLYIESMKVSGSQLSFLSHFFPFPCDFN